MREADGGIKFNNLREESAIDFIIRATNEQPGEITIICLAPLSNIGAAYQKDPTLPLRVKNLVIMGGTFLGQGNTDYFSSEYNFFKDPDSTALVFDNFDNLTLVPLESTFFQRDLPKEVTYKPYM